MRAGVDLKEMSSTELLGILRAKQETFFFKEALELYIPPRVGRFVGDDESKDAAETIEVWIKNPDKQCLLLLGDSGAGKTLFGQWLTRQGFQNKGMRGRIPLFIPLLAQKHPEEGLVDHYLKKTCGIEDRNQREWIKQQPLLLILDGFDEINQKINLYRSNKLWQYKDIKIIISCRSQALANIHDYASLFCPYDADGEPQSYRLQEYVVNPFTEKQIEAYLQHYVNTHQVAIKETLQISDQKTSANTKKYDWLQWETYQSTIQKLPGLKSLLSSPFVLSLVGQVLPTIMLRQEEGDQTKQLHLARINLYDYFIAQWFTRQKKKLLDAGHISDNCPIEEAYTEYSKKLAHEMLQKNVTSVEYKPKTEIALLKEQGLFSNSSASKAHDEDPWSIFFVEKPYTIGNDEVKLSFIRAGCPLMKLGENQYAFLHKSLLEYFAARKLFEGAMNSASIALGLELNEKLLIDEPETLDFLAERVEQDDKLKQCLFDILEESKYEERVQIAAANAITILNYAGVSFSQIDLRHIRVSGADLSNSLLDSTDLREADLRHVKLNSAWLNNAKLGGALIEKIQFGELPYLDTGNSIHCIASSPDGRYLASGYGKVVGNFLNSWNEEGSSDIDLWDLALGKRVGIFKGHTKSVSSVAFSSDGKQLVSGSTDGTVRLWNVESQKSLGELKENCREIYSVAFSPDGKIIAAGSTESIYFWDVENQKKVGEIMEYCSCITFSPDGKTIGGAIGGGWGKTVCLWDVKSREQIGILEGLVDFARSVAFSPDGKVLASGGSKGKDKDSTALRLWNVKSRKQIGIMKGPIDSVESVAFSPDGKMLAAGDKHSVYLWDVVSQKLLGIMDGHKHSVTGLVFSTDSKTLISGSCDQKVRFWDTSNLKHMNSKKYNNLDVVSVAFGEILVSGGANKMMHFWDILNQKSLGIIESPSDIRAIALSPDGSLLASGGFYMQLWKPTEQRAFLGELSHQSANCAVNCVTFSPDGSLLASGNGDETVRLWDPIKRRPLGVLKGHTSSVSCIAFSPDGKTLASGGCDYPITFIGAIFGNKPRVDTTTVHLWDVLTQTHLGILRGHTNSVTGIVFSPNEKLLASGSKDGTIRLWDLSLKKPLRIINAGSITSIAFSPDGSILATGNENKTVHLWDVNEGKCLNSLKLMSNIKTLAFKKMKEKNCLCVGGEKSIYYFEIKFIQSELNIILLWSIGRTTVLTCNQLDVGGAIVARDHEKNIVSTDAMNDRLLRQHGVVGKLSQKNTQEVLEARRHAIPYNSKQPPRNLFSGEHFIMPNNAMVSLARKKADKGSEHVFLVIELINESGCYAITKTDFYLDQTQKHSKVGVFVSGQALIEICTKSLSDMQILASQCVYKCWKISDEQLGRLLTNLEEDRHKRITYWNMGDSTLYSAIERGTDKHNCLSWCEGHLAKIGIDISEQKSWLDVIVAHPQYHLQNEEEPNSINNCLMM